MDQLLRSLNLSTIKDILDLSLGLSLTDCLWVTASATQKWADVNLYDNQFSEVIAHAAFAGGAVNIKFSATSPEFCTDGMLSKCWVRESDGIYLKKADAGKALTVYGEVLASTHEQDLDRVYTLRGLGYTPYIMVYDRPNAPDITRKLQRWVNNRRIFFSVPDFKDYIPNWKGGPRED